MIVINLIDKSRLQGGDSFYAGDGVAWKARLYLFVGFALMAGGLAGSVVSMHVPELFGAAREGGAEEPMTQGRARLLLVIEGGSHRDVFFHSGSIITLKKKKNSTHIFLTISGHSLKSNQTTVRPRSQVYCQRYPYARTLLWHYRCSAMLFDHVEYDLMINFLLSRFLCQPLNNSTVILWVAQNPEQDYQYNFLL
ncbi:hypothetical protein BC938DRAFT_482221 [Jimgerdemannia flammicorona]|uniref:Uncharacterized protein n=1 Tax=Jimgerdemannia flammicorona TaxID=994334 RepID=A0A433QEB6_9FUNG|nr:hypothetical protein BC938DRAFT_482221 [Jimgerdemannia flammicorona]